MRSCRKAATTSSKERPRSRSPLTFSRPGRAAEKRDASELSNAAWRSASRWFTIDVQRTRPTSSASACAACQCSRPSHPTPSHPSPSHPASRPGRSQRSGSIMSVQQRSRHTWNRLDASLCSSPSPALTEGSNALGRAPGMCTTNGSMAADSMNSLMLSPGPVTGSYVGMRLGVTGADTSGSTGRHSTRLNSARHVGHLCSLFEPTMRSVHASHMVAWEHGSSRTSRGRCSQAMHNRTPSSATAS